MTNGASVLSSWKEIANHLGKGVRTVQRWERELGLPVRRPQGRDRQIVLAFPEELDDWVRAQSNGCRNGRVIDTHKPLVRLQSLMQRLSDQIELMIVQSRINREQLNRAQHCGNGGVPRTMTDQSPATDMKNAA